MTKWFSKTAAFSHRPLEECSSSSQNPSFPSSFSSSSTFRTTPLMHDISSSSSPIHTLHTTHTLIEDHNPLTREEEEQQQSSSHNIMMEDLELTNSQQQEHQQEQQLVEKQQKVQELALRYPSLFQQILVFEDDESQCPICLELYNEENPEVKCKCGHGFHLQCSEEWRQRSSECPVCFRKLIYDFEEEELPKESEHSTIKSNRNSNVRNSSTYYNMNEPLVRTRESTQRRRLFVLGNGGNGGGRTNMLKRMFRCLCCCCCCC
ncbi:hypothetical protein FDP41_006986 [Naegleria fowleri]|uniref:RING-type E3 ubiquitin transferase n=1 Tax=Naegleria fowleri TaxID=5763 RepID=A0A6A5B5W9_NAEFO|nr:uncharacterized protein FDP41_006986 [Naegleria fowleri]KAF0974003.1 hypothetical protein FDP41_006986 [Naegleria fowleri]